MDSGGGTGAVYYDEPTLNDITWDRQKNVQGPDDSEPVFSGFCGDEILVASNKEEIFSELISSFEN